MVWYITLLLILTTYVFHCLCVLKDTIDLTWDFDNETIYWPGVEPFSYTKIIANNITRGYWYAANEFCSGEHGGTHFDAPYHFNEKGWKVGEVPLAHLIAKGSVLHLHNATQSLHVSHLQEWEQTNGPIDEGTVLLVNFGRSQYWKNKTRYMEYDEDFAPNFPGISVEAANWIANSKKIVGVGVDTPSVDAGRSREMMTHRIFAKNQIYNLENVKIIEKLPSKGFTLLILPMKLRDGSGAPVRILAVPNNFNLI